MVSGRSFTFQKQLYPFLHSLVLLYLVFVASIASERDEVHVVI